jgi:hypothetical protein
MLKKGAADNSYEMEPGNCWITVNGIDIWIMASGNGLVSISAWNHDIDLDNQEPIDSMLVEKRKP